ncbi:MAG TPA: glycosyltransferase [Mycobacteriales bacterium]|nr:glycosyltransferase [Mycobacteriales bacterium]
MSSTLVSDGSRPRVTVVVPTRDRPGMLDRCLGSVAPQLQPGDELLVVDSASHATAELSAVAARHGARLLRSDRAGASVARNLGWRAARSELVCYADDDVWVDAGWVTAFASTLAAHPEAAFVTGRIDIPAGQHARFPVSIKDDPAPATYRRDSAGVAGHAASLALRREALTRVGGWDEELGAGARFPGAEELDLFDRIYLTGACGRYEPAARAWHDQWRDLPTLVRLGWRYGVGAGARMAKLARADRKRLRFAAVESFWSWHVRDLLRHRANRDRFIMAVTAARLAGTVCGFARALWMPVVAGHLRPRRERNTAS